MQTDRFSVNCSIIFTELPMLERAAAAAATGFSKVEFWWPFATAAPRPSEIDAFIGAIDRAGVKLSGLNLFAGDMTAGERGILSAPGREQEFEQNLSAARRILTALDCHVVNALYGNRLEGEDPATQDAVARRRLAELSQLSSETDSVIVLEPLSGVDAYPLKLAKDAFAVMDALHESGASTSLGLLADLYHLAVNGEDVDGLLDNEVARFGHVQIADAPGRGEPGTGSLPIVSWLEKLEVADYLGAVGLEYRPSTTSLASFNWIH